MALRRLQNLSLGLVAWKSGLSQQSQRSRRTRNENNNEIDHVLHRRWDARPGVGACRRSGSQNLQKCDSPLVVICGPYTSCLFRCLGHPQTKLNLSARRIFIRFIALRRNSTFSKPQPLKFAASIRSYRQFRLLAGILCKLDVTSQQFFEKFGALIDGKQTKSSSHLSVS